jgi:multidrug efflux pump subunit AcrA (membrane-fusion protein)
VRQFAAAVFLFALSACTRPTPSTTYAAPAAQPAAPGRLKREVRVTGTVQAVHSSKVLIPQIYGNYSSMTLTHLIANGASVKEGDLIATFDATNMMDTARDAKGKFDDFGHQVDQKRAQNRADAEKRASDLKQAEADLATALQELRKGPVLSEIDRLKNEQKAAIARIHVESLTRANAFHDTADAAALRVLELQHERQKVAMERAQTNIDKLTLKAPLSGMVAQENLFRSNTMGHAQEGDQLYRGQPLVSIFDPTEMQVVCSVGEPDVAALVPGVRATVHLDAYPDLSLPAHFEYSSPVASSGFGSPIKTFTAVFHIDKGDPHLLPDLSAAIVLEQPVSQGERSEPHNPSPHAGGPQ